MRGARFTRLRVGHYWAKACSQAQLAAKEGVCDCPGKAAPVECRSLASLSGTKAAVHMWACVHATCPFGDAPPVIRRKLRVEAGGGNREVRAALCSTVQRSCPGLCGKCAQKRQPTSADRTVFPAALRPWPGQCQEFCAALPAWRHTWPPHCRNGPTKGAPWPGQRRADA